LRLNQWLGSDFIAVSDSVADYLHKLLRSRSNNVYVIENAISSPGKTNNINVRDLCGWPQDAIVLIVAARLEPVKGLGYLLKAFALASQNQPNLRLCIIGAGRCLEELQTQAQTLNIKHLVNFTGFRQDVFDLFEHADIFCLPSLSEGLPYAVLEAALSRLPLLLSQVGGMAVLFEHGKTAYFFSPQDVSVMVQGLLTLANNTTLRIELGQAAYQLVNDKFSLQAMLQATLNVYNQKEMDNVKS
jgi:glycosyltransferase involved in cell wall biosynthesis